MATGGGTAAPASAGSRTTAAAVALGAPRAPSRGKVAKPTRPPKAPAKGPPRIPQHTGTAHPGARPHTGPPGQQSQPKIFNPLGGFLNERQLQGVARNQTNEALKPIQQREREIGNIEGTASNRFAGYAQAEQGRFGEIQNQQQASAKSYENTIANSAMRTAGEVDTAGQQAALNSAGYVAPEVRAALGSAGNLAGQTGAAQSLLGTNLSQGETNFLANMRAAAVQRATEGQANIPTAFAKQRASLGSEESKAISGIPALASKLGQEQFKDYITAQGLGIKQGTLSLNRQKAGTAARQGQEKINQAGEKIAQTGALGRERNAATRERNQITRELGQGKLAISQQQANTAASRAKTYAESVRNKLSKEGVLSTTGQSKLQQGIATAYAVTQELREGAVREGKKGSLNSELAGIRAALNSGGGKDSAGKSVKLPRVSDALLQQAGIELYEYHHVSPTTQRQLSQRGLRVPAEWTNGSFRGF
jgi:hypothetical protein